MSRRVFMTLLGLFCVQQVWGQQLVRGPYLGMPTETQITVRWKTNAFCRSTIYYGFHPDTMLYVITDSITKVNHLIRLDTLLSDTKYFYKIAYDSVILAGDSSFFFQTSPATGSNTSFGIWVLGCSGYPGQKQLDVRDKFVNYMAGNTPDLMIMLGDNAYANGTEAEYQTRFFDIYEEYYLKNSPVYLCPGNHEYIDSFQQINNVCDYYSLFSLPSQGECGGVASDTMSYYSFDYGNTHFISLNSYAYENGTFRLYDTLSPQVNWLKQDLDSNQLEWTVVFFHHPPYSKGSHDSDAETELILLRENITPILERYSVDLVLYGHSHSYERSYLMKNHHGFSNTFDKTIHTVDSSSAVYNGFPNTCAYNKTAEQDSGTVYIQAGHGSINDPVSAGWPHPAMVSYNKDIEGSLYLKFSDKRLDMEYIGRNGFVLDRFTMFHDAGKSDSIFAEYGDTLLLWASWQGEYVWADGNTNMNIEFVVSSDTVIVVSDQFSCISDTFFIHMNPLPEPPELIRGPYLQKLFSNEVTVRWRSNKDCLGAIRFGLSVDSLHSLISDTLATSEHLHQLINLLPETKYFYQISCDTNIYTIDSLHWFITESHSSASNDTTLIWVTGNLGTGQAEQVQVLNSFLCNSTFPHRYTWISLGDNAFPDGKDSSYQNKFFDVYQDDLLRNLAVYPIPGEIDYNQDSSLRISNQIDFYSIFSLPFSGFSSGLNSETPLYYSFDKGDVHFSMLNSFGFDSMGLHITDTLNAQHQWLEQDLSASQSLWKIVTIHHPPYSRGHIDSDIDTLLISIREKLNPLFEKYNVDLVVSSRNNTYERSYFMRNHFGSGSTFDSTFVVQSGNGSYDGMGQSCAYLKSGESDSGTVYIVAGSSGGVANAGNGWPHPAMIYSDSSHAGSVLVEVIQNRMDVKFLASDSIVYDRFTIIKESGLHDTLFINLGDSILLEASWPGNYYWMHGDTTRQVWVKPAIDSLFIVYDAYGCLVDSFYVDVLGVNVGLVELETPSAGLLIRPVPSHIGETIYVKTYGIEKAYVLELIDNTGRILSKQSVTDPYEESKFRLKSGIYIFRIVSNDKILSKRCIVQ